LLGFVYFFGSTRKTCVTSFLMFPKVFLCCYVLRILWHAKIINGTGIFHLLQLIEVGLRGEGFLRKKGNDTQFRLDYHRRWKDKVWPFFTIFFVCFFWEFSFSIFVRLLVYLLFLHENLQFTRLKFWSFWFCIAASWFTFFYLFCDI
jgi:hypothetical protein